MPLRTPVKGLTLPLEPSVIDLPVSFVEGHLPGLDLLFFFRAQLPSVTVVFQNPNRATLAFHTSTRLRVEQAPEPAIRALEHVCQRDVCFHDHLPALEWFRFLRNWVHRRERKGDFLVLSGERPESTKTQSSDTLDFWFLRLFSLAVLSTARENCAPLRPLRLCGENLIWTRMILVGLPDLPQEVSHFFGGPEPGLKRLDSVSSPILVILIPHLTQ